GSLVGLGRPAGGRQPRGELSRAVQLDHPALRLRGPRGQAPGQIRSARRRASRRRGRARRRRRGGQRAATADSVIASRPTPARWPLFERGGLSLLFGLAALLLVVLDIHMPDYVVATV